MNCFNCQKLDWEIEMERRKKEVSWWKVIGGMVIGTLLMTTFWFFAIKYYNSLMMRPREIKTGEHSWIERDGQKISWYSFEKMRGVNYKENVTDMQLWKHEIEEISGQKASEITFKNYVPADSEERDIIKGWAERIDSM